MRQVRTKGSNEVANLCATAKELDTFESHVLEKPVVSYRHVCLSKKWTCYSLLARCLCGQLLPSLSDDYRYMLCIAV